MSTNRNQSLATVRQLRSALANPQVDALRHETTGDAPNAGECSSTWDDTASAADRAMVPVVPASQSVHAISLPGRLELTGSRVIGTAAAGPSGPAALASKRTYWRTTRRDTAFVTSGPARELLAWAAGAEVDRVYVVGKIADGTRASVRRWALDLPDGWRAGPGGHYLEDAGTPTLRFVHDSGRKVSIMSASAWFGDGDYTASDAMQAWQLGERLVRDLFDGAQLADSPGSAGRRLFARTIPEGPGWPVMPLDAQARIHATSGQGRIELVTELAELPALVEYDGRVMYLALLAELGSGLVAHDDAPTFDPYAPGWYRVTATVPRSWDHVGLLPVAAPDRHGKRSWSWPNGAGEQFETWASGAELLIAQRNGWRIDVAERMLFGKGRPLDAWARQMTTALTRCESRVTSRQGEPWALVRAMVRAMVLHAVGAFYGRPRKVTRQVPVAAAPALPPGAQGVRKEGDSIVWTELQPPAWASFAHPEWSAQIYGRARARLLVGPRGIGALSIPADRVVAFRTDAIYTTVRVPEWESLDDGKPGRMRCKGVTAGPLVAPRNQTELLAMRDA